MILKSMRIFFWSMINFLSYVSNNFIIFVGYAYWNAYNGHGDTHMATVIQQTQQSIRDPQQQQQQQSGISMRFNMCVTNLSSGNRFSSAISSSSRRLATSHRRRSRSAVISFIFCRSQWFSDSISSTKVSLGRWTAGDVAAAVVDIVAGPLPSTVEITSSDIEERPLTFAIAKLCMAESLDNTILSLSHILLSFHLMFHTQTGTRIALINLFLSILSIFRHFIFCRIAMVFKRHNMVRISTRKPAPTAQ